MSAKVYYLHRPIGHRTSGLFFTFTPQRQRERIAEMMNRARVSALLTAQLTHRSIDEVQQIAEDHPHAS